MLKDSEIEASFAAVPEAAGDVTVDGKFRWTLGSAFVDVELHLNAERTMDRSKLDSPLIRRAWSHPSPGRPSHAASEALLDNGTEPGQDGRRC